MKRFLSVVFAVFFAFTATSCVHNETVDGESEDFVNDNEASYYTEYVDEDFIPDEDVAKIDWDVNFSFSGTINDGNAENIIDGSGLLTYIDSEKNAFTVNSATWVIKKDITLNSGKKVPMLQVFFADNAANVDEDGRVLYFILQLEGSSVSSKSETYYLNNDKIYKAKVKLDDETGKVKEICYIPEPDPSKGIVHIFTNNIRIGEELKIGGYANMIDMENSDCKKMN